MSTRIRPRDHRVAAAAAVLVTIGAAVIGGTAAGRVTEPVGTGTEAAPGPRTFVCTGGVGGTQVLSGTVPRGTTRHGAGGARVVRVPEAQAPGAFATQVARRGKALAAGLCPEPRNDWWFVGAGGAVRHSSVVTVHNPRPGSAVVNVEVLGPRGPVVAPGLQGITIPGGGRRTFALDKVAPATGDLLVHVRANRGLVSVGVADTFALGGGIGAQVGEWLPDQFRPARTVLLTGLERRPAFATLLVANPGDTEAIVDVDLVGEKGPFVPRGVEKISVPPRSVVSADLRRAFDGQAVAVRLTASLPVVATVRTTRAGDQVLASAGFPLQGDTAVAIPDGSARDLVVTGVADGTLTFRAYGAAGRLLREQDLQVRKDTTRAERLPAGARYVVLMTRAPLAVASVVVSNPSGGSAAVGVPPAARALRVPPVSPAW